LAGHVAGMEEMMNVYKLLVRKPQDDIQDIHRLVSSGREWITVHLPSASHHRTLRSGQAGER